MSMRVARVTTLTTGVVTALGAMLLAGCGQKGQLFLPQHTPPAVVIGTGSAQQNSNGQQSDRREDGSDSTDSRDSSNSANSTSNTNNTSSTSNSSSTKPNANTATTSPPGNNPR